MSNEKLPNAPLLELMVIVGWTARNLELLTPEALERSFRSELQSKVAYELERLVSPEAARGIEGPFLAFHLWESAEGPTVTLGIGGLALSTTQPYENWEGFRPSVELAVTTLMNATEHLGGLEINSVDIRYVDAFGPEYWEGRSPDQFLTETLGLQVLVPNRMTLFCPESENRLGRLAISRKTSDGTDVSLGAGTAIVQGRDVLIVEFGVSRALSEGAPIQDPAEVLAELDSAQRIAHQGFEELAAPVMVTMRGETR